MVGVGHQFCGVEFMNEQRAIAVEKSVPEDGKIAVHEMFYTLQGEGPLSGTPALFVRLAGCNLRCASCDTSYSNFNRFPIRECAGYAKALAEEHCALCVVTGGEPFRQASFPELVRELLFRFLTVQIETSGSCWQPSFGELKLEFKDRVVVVCSPKTSKVHPELVPHIDHYKYVVSDVDWGVLDDGLPGICPQTGKRMVVARPQLNRTGCIPPVWVSPWDVQDAELNEKNTQMAVASCLQHGYRLSLQVHKLVGLS